MIILVLFAFLAGIVTILSPCILPILPIVLSSTIGGQQTGKRRPFGVVLGFIFSFTFFTLFLSTIVNLSGISADAIRLFSVVIISIFGISLLIPQFQLFLERLFSSMTKLIPMKNQNDTKAHHGFIEGFIIGISIGLLWTPCVGPILASVITLAITGSVNSSALIITLAYALGTAIPMFAIMIGGQSLLKKVPWLLSNTLKIQKAFGIIMIITAAAIFFNLDRKFQTFILNTFPQYGTGLTQIEDNEQIRKELNLLNNNTKPNDAGSSDMIGKPASDIQPKGPPAPKIIPGGQWFNSKNLSLSDLKGKVVLIDFWTYSCINCQRTLPYLKTWWDKYSDKDFVIIGVHSPEFEFEKNPDNVRRAIEDFGIKYPVVQDNEFSTWRAYNNRYWPAKYLVDKDGNIRYTHFGEGAYDESEKFIQELLSESSQAPVTYEIKNPKYELFSSTPETYLGYERIANFASPELIKQNQNSKYSRPAKLAQNQLAFDGDWIISAEYANPQKGASLHMKFNSKEVYLVMRPKTNVSRLRIYLDNKQDYLGSDVIEGIVNIDSPDLYKLIKLNEPGSHDLKLEFLDNDTEIYAFTFG